MSRYSDAAVACGMESYVEVSTSWATMIYFMLTEAGTSFMSTSEPYSNSRRIYLSATSRRVLEAANILPTTWSSGE